MSWSKVNSKHSKPFGWWYHKIMCEIGWSIKHSGKMYYRHLHKLCKYGYNLYGDKF